MNQSWKVRLLSLVLIVVMVFGALPMTVLATETEQTEGTVEEQTVQEPAEEAAEEPVEEPAEEEEEEEAVAVVTEDAGTPAYSGGFDMSQAGCDFYNVIENKTYNLVPGAIEREIVINDASGSRRQVVHAIEVEPGNAGVSVMPSFKSIGTGADYNDVDNWGSITVTDHAAHAEENLGKNVVGGMNVSLSWDFTHPYGLLMYEGEILHDSRSSCELCGTSGHPGGGYLVVKKDGSFELRDPLAPVEEDDWMAQTVCFSYLIKDGVNLNSKYDHSSEGAPRSVIGIKADGTLVLMMTDGRMSPYSAGLSNHEMSEIMLSLGCVDAINCDGGGSSTFMTEREGSGELSVKSRFSDGSERQTLTAILVLSEAEANGEFHHAVIEKENDYVTPYSEVTFTATGVDGAGGPAELPEEISWQMEDASMGSVEDGVFTSNGTAGTAVVQMVYDGEVVGEGSVEVVIPESLEFVQTNITAPYSKTVELEMIAKYGYSEVALKEGDVSFELSDGSIGTIEGYSFVATSDETASTSGTVVATLVHDTEVTATASISLGRASEVVYDFEAGAESISNIYLSYKSPYTPDKYYFNDTISVVSAEEGKVKSGNYALKVTADGDSITCMNWCQTRINGWDIDLTDAVSLSFWIYVPEGSHGYEWDFGNAIPVVLGHEFAYGTGWQYLTMPVSTIGTTNLDQIRLYHSDTNNTDIGYLHNERPNYYADAVFYIDDITVNYSTAVEDFDPPVFSNAAISYEGIDTAVAMNGQEISANVVAVTANVKDSMEKSNYTGLDTSSVVLYVDGVEADVDCTSNGLISTGDMALANGTHIFRFEASDNRGNTSYIEKSVVIAGDGEQDTIVYVPADPTLTDVPSDSLVWMDLKATAIENVDTVSTVVDLDNNSTWELDHMELADGFTAEYTIDSESNDATITITRTGTVAASGEAVLASLPVRVWKPVFGNDGNEDAHAYRLMAVISYVQMGQLTETDGTTTVFASEIHQTMTEWNNTRLSSAVDKEGWHAHNAIAADDLAATCTKPGYAGRTFCEECNSVVDWGTATEATGHTYVLTDGVLACECGETFTGIWEDGVEYEDGVALAGWVGDSYYVDGQKITGIVKVAAPGTENEFYYNFGDEGVCEGKVKYTGMFLDGDVYRYAYLGVITNGWQTVDGSWYYFKDDAAVSGSVKISGVVFEFEADGKLTSGVWAKNMKGTRYYYGPSYYTTGWQTIDGEQYCFQNGYCLTGCHFVGAANDKTDQYWFVFDEDGAYLHKANGLIEAEGGLRYIIDGVQQIGLTEVDGDYYFFDYDGAVTGKQYAWKTNCDLPCANYYFGEDYKAVNGLVETDEGVYYYTYGRVGTTVGLTEIDGEYYFVESTGACFVGKKYAWKTNCDLPCGTYEFGTDGKMLQGLVEKEDGMYYYVNGAANRDMVGLNLIDGGYYFLDYDGKCATGIKYVWQTNCDLMCGTYEFGADGRMLDGIVTRDDGVYYYVNGNADRAMVGLNKIGEDYYFIGYDGKCATGSKYAWETNCDLPCSTYEFAEDGKMLNGIVEKDGGYFYYENGKPRMAGLVEIDGAYYFARDGRGEIVTGKSYYVWQGNGLLPESTYEFGADGKMLNGIVEKDGGYFYYENGKPRMAGLVEVDGAYYFARDGRGEIVTGKAYYVWQGNGLLPEATYEFGADGKMLDGIVVKEDGYYFYVDGKVGKAGLNKVGEDYYFVEYSGKCFTGKKYAWATNCDLPCANYEFGADGKMLDGFVTKEDGIYYYVNGRFGTVGLNYVDGHYYFVGYDGKLIVNQTFYVWQANGLLVEANYTFNELGQIIG